MDKEVKNKIEYMIACISEFADRYGLSSRQAFSYLYFYKGIAFLDNSYEAEHQFSIEDAVDDVTDYCKRQGGALA
ncbi:MAG TPA: hypothetical protein DDZ96_13510 [Porphyromonadaceae bacterium]|jgi:hypothetical protein|uniref:DUF3791 domain-containing protein n=1 Tax=Limibacterium fermenti TaxID=3229863 RepID=UPI000E8B6A02|nr:hypothetical protein [Porphyromonadaceae bacterium]HBK31864.1 hypothetical protein [Porphyromonadaceae bacterium]HBL34812.1 hypothetical protein [Porphyromonadaceae bacterium]HBX20543.1 hypothetical protein [Porphyromonadaceae bacterium]HBX45782.1 hypothetical protein [Porphyromonadaceae bacterium]